MESDLTKILQIINKKIRDKVLSFEDLSKYVKNTTQAQIVFLLFNNQDKTIFQKDICEEIGLKKSSITEQLDLLEEAGVITRIADKKDRRKNRITLTDEALKMIKTIDEEVVAFNQKMMEGVADEELKIFMKVLDKMEKNVR